ncbi:MAG: FkbM family methyltransferase [Nanoarchaeota archaeon]|nr:FkbM family methyltransferase [Nanoarchaeota archaeon]
MFDCFEKRKNQFLLTLKIIKKTKNFPILFLNYFRINLFYKIIKRKNLLFKSRGGEILSVRKMSDDLQVIMDVWIKNIYFPNEKFKIKDGSTIIDIGAHIGAFSILASKSAKNVKVFSYEPLKENYNLLLKNISLNKADIKAFNVAVWKKNIIKKIYRNPKYPKLSSHTLISKSNLFYKVPCVSLKEIFDKNNLKKCDFLKIDAEGSEYEILLNTPKKYLKKIKAIVLECHTYHPKYKKEDLKKFLEFHDFKNEKILKDENVLYYYLRT